NTKYEGAGISGYDLTVQDCVVTNNRGDYGGGGIHANSLTLLNSVVANNVGGGISAGSLYAKFCAVLNNSGVYPGISVGELYLENCTVAGNTYLPPTPNNYGGGITIFGSYDKSQSSLITNSTIVNNYSSGDGGGVYLSPGWAGAVLQIQNSTIVDNSANRF